MQDIDRIAEANVQLDRRARQREAKAAALLELTPEAIKAEEERQRRHAAEALLEDPLEGVTPEMVEAAQETVGHTLSDKLAEALQPVVDGPAGDESEIVAIGRAVFQWILVPSEENEGDYQLGLQLQVDEQPPGGFAAEITQEQLDSWAAGKGLQGNRIEHKQFVSALFERFLAVGLNETGNALVYALEQLIQAQEDGGPEKWEGGYKPTETAVGDADEPYLPEMSD